MEREDNLNNILNGGGLNNNIDTQMNNISNENSGNGGDIPSIYTVGTTPDVLNRIKGEYCICEFVVGSDTLVTKEGSISYVIYMPLNL